MLKSAYCPACSTTNNKCQTCGINVCDIHSPDAEENQSNRHCEPCLKKWWQKKCCSYIQNYYWNIELQIENVYFQKKYLIIIISYLFH